MSRKKVLFWCLVAPLAVMVPATAGAELERSGVYGYAEVGHADVERAVGSVDRIDGNNTAYTLGVGYAFTPAIALQVAYRDYGEIGATVGCPPDLLCVADTSVSLVPFSNDRVDLKGASMEVVGTWPLRQWPVALTGKAGVLAWDADGKHHRQLNQSGNDWLLGVGARWAPTARWTVQLGYEHVDMDIRALNGGVSFRF